MLKNIRKELIVNLIASLLFVSFINPIFELLWKLLKNSYSAYVNNAYLNASLGQRNWLDFMLFTLVLIVGYNTLILFTLRSIRNSNEYYKKEAEKIKIKEMTERGEDVQKYIASEVKRIRRKVNEAEENRNLIKIVF